jgi:phosphotransferase system HPr-like phosphotransfer protein
MSDIDFIEYDKISIQSDAFITSAELNCYFQYVPSTKAISYNIKKELHTAGTTEDPNDYKIPDVSSKILPRKLYRINPFHTNYSENLELNKVNIDPDIIYPTKVKEYKEKIIDYSSFGLNSDQIEFMMALQNLKSLKSDDSIKKLNIEQFESVDERVMNGFFQLYPRFMEMLTSGVSSGGFNQYFEDTESQESLNENETLINEAIKKLGLNPNEVKVKKKFEVRPGNAKKEEVNAYLQDVSLSNNIANNTRSISNNSVTNVNQLNLQNNNKIELKVRSSRTVNNINTANNTDFNFINNTNRTVNQQVTNVSKFSEATKIDFENLYKAFLKDLNIAPNVENQFFKIVNQHSKNLSIEFNRILNHSEKTVYETNLKNLSTSYNFYRHIENRYREFIQNLNFFNDTVQQIRQTEVNLKNTYQNIHRHSVTHKNNHYKNILNLTKNVNYEYTANDYEFQYAVLKTIKNSNQYV